MTMHWEPLGQIFSPSHHRLPNGCEWFAQSPQALVCDDFVRIYFSTRAKDPINRKFLSHVCYVDMSKDLKTLRGVAEHTVLPLGELGTFDEHGIFPINPVRVGNEVYAYTCGWSRRVSVSVETAIGLAVSHDNGQTFARMGPGPVLGSSLNEPYLVGDGFVMQVSGVFHMWYIFGTEWKQYSADTPPDRTYKIGHATSSDGICWTKEEARQIISDRLGPDESQALPTVVQIGEQFHMFFCYRESFDFRASHGRGYRIGHAWSDNLSDWHRDDGAIPLPVSTDGWESHMQCYPHVFHCDGEVYMLYNGNAFGREGFGAARLVGR